MAGAGTITKLTKGYERTTEIIPAYFAFALLEETPTGPKEIRRFRYQGKAEAEGAQERAFAAGFPVGEIQHVYRKKG